MTADPTWKGMPLDAETALPRWRATWVDGRIAADDVARDAHDAATPA